MWPNLVVNTRGREFILYDHHYDPKHPHHLVFNMINVCMSVKAYQGIVADFLPFFKKDFPPPQPVTQPGGGGNKGKSWVAMDTRQLAQSNLMCKGLQQNILYLEVSPKH